MRTNGVSRKQRQLKAATLAWLPIAVLLCCHSTTWAAAPDVYAPRPVDEVRTQLTRWLTQHSFNNEKTASQIAAVWSAGGGAAAGRDAFDRLITSFSIADSETRRFVETSTPGQSIKVFPSADFLNRDDADEFYSMNLRLFYARALTQRLMYDEALASFRGSTRPGLSIRPRVCSIRPSASSSCSKKPRAWRRSTSSCTERRAWPNRTPASPL